mmetsp:Transcript_7745/g.19185  ORF Transcript_7745/g.19185 Transcript_7745/m.19185 type:complete len:97 (+) Transcript_7745:140-430(+)
MEPYLLNIIAWTSSCNSNSLALFSSTRIHLLSISGRHVNFAPSGGELLLVPNKEDNMPPASNHLPARTRMMYLAIGRQTAIFIGEMSESTALAIPK